MKRCVLLACLILLLPLAACGEHMAQTEPYAYSTYTQNLAAYDSESGVYYYSNPDRDIYRFDPQTGESEPLLSGCRAAFLRAQGGSLYFLSYADGGYYRLEEGTAECVIPEVWANWAIFAGGEVVYPCAEADALARVNLKSGETELVELPGEIASQLRSVRPHFIGGKLIYRDADCVQVVGLDGETAQLAEPLGLCGVVGDALIYTAEVDGMNALCAAETVDSELTGERTLAQSPEKIEFVCADGGRVLFAEKNGASLDLYLAEGSQTPELVREELPLATFAWLEPEPLPQLAGDFLFFRAQAGGETAQVALDIRTGELSYIE